MSHFTQILKNGIHVIYAPVKITEFYFGFFIRSAENARIMMNSKIGFFLVNLLYQTPSTDPHLTIYDTINRNGYVSDFVAKNGYFHAYLSGHLTDMNEIIRIILLVYQSTDFREEDFNKFAERYEKSVQYIGNIPEEKIDLLINEKLFRDSEDPETANLNLEKLIQLRRQLFVPEDTVFVMMGSFRVDKMHHLLERKIGSIQSPPIELLDNNETDSYRFVKEKIEKQTKPYFLIKRNGGMDGVLVKILHPLFRLPQEYPEEISLLIKLLYYYIKRYLFFKNPYLYFYEGDINYLHSFPFLVLKFYCESENFRKIYQILRRIYKKIMDGVDVEIIHGLDKNEVLERNVVSLNLFLSYGTRFFDKNRGGARRKSDKSNHFPTGIILQKSAGKIFQEEKTMVFLYGKIKKLNI